MLLLTVLLACRPADTVVEPMALRERAAALPFDVDPPQLIVAESVPPTKLSTLGDFDGDGWIDVVGQDGNPSDLVVQRGGPVGFSAATSFSHPDYVSSLAATDLDGDGDDDLVAGISFRNDFDGQIEVYLGSPSGLVFYRTYVGSHAPDGTPGQFGSSAAAAGDVYGSSNPDIVVGMPGRHWVVVVHWGNDANFQFVDAPPSSFVLSGLRRGWTIVRTDVPFAAFHAEVWRDVNGPVATYDATIPATAVRGAQGAGDVDGDGLEDLVVWNTGSASGGPGSARLYLGVAGGGFAAGSQSLPVSDGFQEGPQGYVGGDFDGDGYGDLLGVEPSKSFPPRSGHWVHRGGPTGIVSTARLTGAAASAAGGGGGDFDRDGLDDVRLANGRILYGSAFGAFRGAASGVDDTLTTGPADGLAPERPATAWAGHSVDGSTALSADARLFLDADCDDLVVGLIPSSPSFPGQVVVYLDATPGGVADTTGLDDWGDPLGGAASGYDGTKRADLTFPEGFSADHAVVFKGDGATVLRLVEGGTHEVLASTFAMGDLLEVAVSLDDLGYAGQPIRFVGTHIDIQGAGRTDGMVGVDRFLAESPGWAPIEFETSALFTPVGAWTATDDVLTVDEGSSGTVDVLANDDSGAPIVVESLAFQAAHGTAVADGGALLYTHDGSETLSDEVTTTWENECGSVATSTVEVTVIPVNDAPAWSTGDGAVVEDTPTSLQVSLVDPDLPGDAVATVDLTVAHGTLSGADQAAVTGGAWGTAHVALSGTLAALQADLDALSYAPDADFSGDDALELVAEVETFEPTGTLPLVVAAVDDPPTPSGSLALVVAEGGAAPIGSDALSASDVDTASAMLSFAVAGASHGDVALGDQAVTSFAFADLGVVAYRHDGSSTSSDAFSITVGDGHASSAPVTVNVTVTPLDDVPVGVADAYNLVDYRPLVVRAPEGVLANDSDEEGDPFEAILVDDVRRGTLSLAADGSFTYTPDEDLRDADTFTYRPGDGLPVEVTLTMLSTDAVDTCGCASTPGLGSAWPAALILLARRRGPRTSSYEGTPRRRNREEAAPT